MTEQEILTYKIEVQGIDSQLQEIGRLDTELKELQERRKQQKNAIDILSASGKQAEGALRSEQKELGKTTVAIKELTARKASLTREVQNAERVHKRDANTLEGMRSKISQLRQEIEREPIDGKRFKEMTTEISTLQGKVNGLDADMKNWRGNVGNYGSALSGMAGQMGFMTREMVMARTAVTTLGGAFKVSTVGVVGTARALNVLKVALISTGIGAIVVLLGSLVTMFKASEEGSTRLKNALAPLTITLSTIKEGIIDLGEWLYRVLGGRESMLNKSAAEIERFEAAEKVRHEERRQRQLERRAQLREELAGMSGWAKFWTSVWNTLDIQQQSIRLAVKLMGDAVADNQKRIKQTQQLNRVEELLAKKKRRWMVDEARLATEAINLDVQSRDKIQYTAQERLAFAAKALEIRRSMLDTEMEIAKAEAEVGKIRTDMFTSTGAELDAQAQREADVFKKEFENSTKQKELLGNYVALQREIISGNAAEAASYSAKQKAFDESYVKALNMGQRIKETGQELKQLTDAYIDESIKGIDAVIASEQERYKIDREFREKWGLEQESLMKAEIAVVNGFLDRKIINEKESQEIIYAIKKKYAEADVKLTQITESEKVAAVSSALYATGTLFKEGSIARKVMASGSVIMSTYSAATAALEPPPVGLGPLWGIPLSATTIAEGLANLAKINGLEFAHGGIIPSGRELPGFSRSGDNTLFLGKPGEVVLNQQHQANLGGPAALAAAGVPGFANGGIVPRMRPPMIGMDGGIDSNSIARAVAKAVGMIPVVVTDRDIQHTRKRVSVREKLRSF